MGRVFCAEGMYIVKRLKASLVEPPPTTTNAHVLSAWVGISKKYQQSSFPPFKQSEDSSRVSEEGLHFVSEECGYMILF